MARGKKLVKKYQLAFFVLLALAAVSGVVVFFLDNNIAVLNPQGSIAQKQFDLIVFTSLLSLIVVIPVFVLTFYIVWKYREGGKQKKKAVYSPDWDGNRLLETVWWLIPLILISILGVIIWNSSHRLDPFRPIAADKEPLTVQVIALEWKWLFIYPEQDIATVNYLQFPQNTPINFRITGDAPMNSFWIPQLGGQVYAMAGMQTELHLMADKPGTYKGSSANISGQGFAGMTFTARSTSAADFDQWVRSVKMSPQVLRMAEYDKLAKPSKDNPIAYYSSRDKDLYDTVIMKYMTPGMLRDEGEHDAPSHAHETGHH
ncbi:MAG: ubiquinol oxidase subunit II, partial [Patescibacteria group bacterium]